jgi:hypothetical protein
MSDFYSTPNFASGRIHGFPDPNDPFARAAYRTRRSVMPPQGRADDGAFDAFVRGMYFDNSEEHPLASTLGNVASPIPGGAVRGVVAAAKAAPRVTAALGGLGLSGVLSSETADAKLTRKQQRELEAKQAALSAEADAKRQQGIDAARIRQEELESKARFEDERAQRLAAEARAEETRRQALPFRERNPELAQNMAYGGMAAGAAVPYIYRLAKMAKLNNFYKKWENAAARTQEAGLEGNKTAGRFFSEQADAFAKQAPAMEAKASKGVNSTRVVAGGLPFEGGALPEQIDWFSGSPEAKAAASHAMNPITDPHRYLGAAAQGFTFSGLGSKLPVFERVSPAAQSMGVVKAERAMRKVNGAAKKKKGE